MKPEKESSNELHAKLNAFMKHARDGGMRVAGGGKANLTIQVGNRRVELRAIVRNGEPELVGEIFDNTPDVVDKMQEWEESLRNRT